MLRSGGAVEGAKTVVADWGVRSDPLGLDPNVAGRSVRTDGLPGSSGDRGDTESGSASGIPSDGWVSGSGGAGGSAPDRTRRGLDPVLYRARPDPAPDGVEDMEPGRAHDPERDRVARPAAGFRNTVTDRGPLAPLRPTADSPWRPRLLPHPNRLGGEGPPRRRPQGELLGRAGASGFCLSVERTQPPRTGRSTKLLSQTRSRGCVRRPLRPRLARPSAGSAASA